MSAEFLAYLGYIPPKVAGHFGGFTPWKKQEEAGMRMQAEYHNLHDLKVQRHHSFRTCVRSTGTGILLGSAVYSNQSLSLPPSLHVPVSQTNGLYPSQIVSANQERLLGHAHLNSQSGFSLLNRRGLKHPSMRILPRNLH